MVASIAAFFAVIVLSLSNGLPAAFASSLKEAGAPQLIPYFTSLSPTGSLFSAFLGYNPVASIIAQLPHSVAATLSNQVVSILTGLHWFPSAIANSFVSSLHGAFYVSAGLSIIAAIASLLRGKRYIHGQPETKLDGKS
jgi:nucleoside recognition membrane protein YjiH